MRLIGSLEKGIIDRICKGDSHIATILLDHVPSMNLYLDKELQPPKLELVIKNSNDNEIQKIAIEQTRLIIFIISFLIYLEEEGYVVTGSFIHGKTVEAYISNTLEFKTELEKNGSRYTHWAFTDKRFYSLIYDYADKAIMPTFHLIKFKKRRYRTEEAIRHTQLIIVAWVAIIVSFIIGVAGIYIHC